MSGLFDDELDDVADRMGAAADAARTAEDVRTEHGPDGDPADLVLVLQQGFIDDRRRGEDKGDDGCSGPLDPADKGRQTA